MTTPQQTGGKFITNIIHLIPEHQQGDIKSSPIPTPPYRTLFL
jgi:hypothetical protein